MRIVADTNVVISGLLYGGLPLRVLRAGESGIVELCTSKILLAELSEVIERPQFDQKFSETKTSRRRLISDYVAIAIVVVTESLAESVSRDADDDHVIACALAADCEFIVTGDKDLLDLKEYRGVRILKVAEFLSELELD